MTARPRHRGVHHALLALGASACSSASGGGDSAERRPAQRGRVLGARGRQRADLRRLRGRPTPARASPSRPPTAPRATRAAPSRAASTPTTCTSRSSPTSSASSTPASSPTDWNAGPTKGIATVVGGRRSSCARATPSSIQGWDDLVKPGVEIITPEPGVVRLGEVEHPRRLGAHHRQRRHRGGRQGVREDSSSSNTIALPSSGREATTAFSEGNGDVLHLLRERGDPGPRRTARPSTTSSRTTRC